MGAVGARLPSEVPVSHVLPRLLALLLAGVMLVACAPEDAAEDTAGEPADEATGEPTDEATDGATEDGATETEQATADECAPDALDTQEPGTLTVATGEPAYEPWVVGDDPESGEGFEAAVAYAVAEELGYARDEVTWTRTDFNSAIQPGPKSFDFNLQQFSILEERRQAVDFSSPYYDVRQAVIALAGNDVADAASIADLRSARLGAAVGTTSFTAIEDVIQPEAEPSVFNSNDEAKLALENGQIDGLVVDLPTAFYITAVELEDGTIVGQLPDVAGVEEGEQFGLVLDLGSPLTECVSAAVDALREDGTLAELEQEWLADVVDVPVLE